MANIEVWQQGIKILYDCHQHNPLLCDFMISCVYCCLDYYEFALDFINQNHDIPKEWEPQYNYLLMATGCIDVSSSLDSIINKKESVIRLI